MSARIEQTATEGAILASKALLEQLTHADAQGLALCTSRASRRGSATPRSRRRERQVDVWERYEDRWDLLAASATSADPPAAAMGSCLDDPNVGLPPDHRWLRDEVPEWVGVGHALEPVGLDPRTREPGTLRA